MPQTGTMSNTVSLQQIADAAGVSKSTVSLALRNHPRIPETTREKIRSVAGGLGYKPNPAVSAWMAHRRRLSPAQGGSCIAFINLWQDHSAWENSPWFTRYVRGACQRAVELGYGFEELRLHAPGMNGKRISSILKARGIRGVIVGSVPEDAGPPELNWSHFAAVAQSNSLVSPELSRSVSDYAHAMRTVTGNLTALGYRRIGYASPRTVEERTDFLHLGAFLAYQNGIPKVNRIPVIDWVADPDDKLEKWISRHRPDAIVSHDLDMERILKRIGLNVPGDIGVAALCLHPRKGCDIAGYDQNLERCGEVAVDLLVGRLNRNETGPPGRPVITMTRGTWRTGRTVRDIP